MVESEPDAETALKREAVLAAIVEAEGIEVSDEEIEEALRASAPPDASDKQLKRALKRARSQGPTRRSARTSRCARPWTSSSRTRSRSRPSGRPDAAGRAAAREKLWTPESAS